MSTPKNTPSPGSQGKPSMSRKELAIKYGISDKLFGKRLKNHGFHFGAVRVLLPKQIEEIITAFGHWQDTHNEP